MARISVIILVVLCVGAGIFAFFKYEEKQKVSQINSFEECAALYPVMESYPPQCITPDEKHFTQNIGNELEYSEEILISTPRPNQTIKNPLKIQGKAKGNWFFEGSFPAELHDGNGKILGTGIMKTDSDWMTEEFVDFAGVIKYTLPEAKEGTLILKNDNPSGLPENQKELKIPVKF